jgi:NAD(P)-dependent dehydrogenase (short-subunit alcohol dehydrogenase family)
MPRMTLDGKTALVTGGARRVGRAIVEELARAGCRVVIHHASSDADAAALAASLATRDYTPAVVRADLRDRTAARVLVDAAVAATGRLDILVNSAAGYARTPLATLSDDAWHEMQELNVAAPMRLMRESAAAGVGAIVNLVDVAAWQPWANWSAYATSKAALLHLSRCLALELAPRTRVNCIAPGTVIFPADWDDARRAAMLAKIPLGREGVPADVARAARFLCEEEFLTGVCIPVDGGAGLR